MNNSKIVNYRLYDPSNSIFKTKANERNKLTIIQCEHYDKCEAYSKGFCQTFMFGKNDCPNAQKHVEIGFTKRARSYYDSLNKMRTKVENTKQLKPYDGIIKCSTHVFINLPHWYMATPIDKYKNMGIFCNTDYIEVEDFTPEFINHLVSLRPQALFGGEIKSYQIEELPKFITQLKSNYPDLYKETAKKSTTIKSYLPKSYVGYKALAYTLKKGCVYNFEQGKGEWDGEKFVFDNYKSLFLPVKGQAKLTLIPDKSEIVEIQNDEQIDNNTKFVK